MTQVDSDRQTSSSIIGRAVASTVVTMAEMGSIGQDILDLHGITEIDPLAWYPSQLRREIHEAVWQRFGDIALLSFGLGLLDFYPETLADFGRSVEQYGTMMTAAHTDEQRIKALSFFVDQMTSSYHRATSASMRVPGVEICFRSACVTDLIYEFTAVTTLAPQHAAFSQGLIEGYIARFVSVDWVYQITPLPERTQSSSEHSELTWRCVFSLKPERVGSSAEYMSWLKLSYKEKLLRSVIAESNKRKTELENLSKQLAKYLPPQIHEALFTGKHDTRITTRRKKLTIFFSDIKGFTQTSEDLQPEALTEYLNEYFSEMTQIAIAHGATIDKYMGDAMMLFFGDPDTRGVKEDARACVDMALRMLERLTILQEKWRHNGFENPFEIRIGINTGYCNVGNFGSDQRLSYTIVGGEVNLAQRLEANADVGGILMSYETWVHVQDMVESELRGSIQMKGIARNVKTYAVTGRKSMLNHPSYAFNHAAGVSIDLDPALLNHELRVELANNLSDLVQKLRAKQ